VSSLILAVEDDGVGMPPGLETQGFGLRIVASAAQKLGATVVSESASVDPHRRGRRTTIVKSQA
jgi:glucose-6-phosphate-specific signal transduction histidine kinase